MDDLGISILSETIGKLFVQHLGPSVVGIDTVIQSKGCLPAMFLRGAGVSEAFITYSASLASIAVHSFIPVLSATATATNASLADSTIYCRLCGI